MYWIKILIAFYSYTFTRAVLQFILVEFSSGENFFFIFYEQINFDSANEFALI